MFTLGKVWGASLAHFCHFASEVFPVATAGKSGHVPNSCVEKLSILCSQQSAAGAPSDSESFFLFRSKMIPVFVLVQNRRSVLSDETGKK